MNKIGLHVGYWLWSGGDKDIFSMVELTHKAGIEVFEVLPGLVLNLSADGRKKLKAMIADYNMALSINGGLNETNDISSDDPAIRRAGVEYCKNVIDAAAEAGADRWSGVNYSAFRKRPDRLLDTIEKQRVWDLSIDSMKKIIKTAEDKNFMYCFEVVNRYEQFMFNTVEEGVAFAKAVESPNAQLLIDAYHMNIEEDSIVDAIQYTADQGKLYHFHVGESNRRIPGNGKTHMPWDEIFAALKKVNYKEYITMESFVLMGNQTALNVSVWRDLSRGADVDKLVSDAKNGAEFVRSFLV